MNEKSIPATRKPGVSRHPGRWGRLRKQWLACLIAGIGIFPAVPLSAQTTPCCETCGPELVTNGDFSDPNCYTGYGTDLDPQAPCNTPGSIGHGGFTETTDASTYSGSWQALDHTGNGSRFILIDGPDQNDGDSRAWQQVVNVTPGRQYCFSAWVKNACNVCGPDPVMELQIDNNGTVVTLTSISLPRGTSTWTQICGTFTAAGNTVDLAVWIKANSIAGNDAALDDVSLKEVCGQPDPDECCKTCGPEKIINGDFSDPNCYTAYGSTMNQQVPCNTPGSIGHGGYTETTDASMYSANWQGLDHTGNGSRFILIDGPDQNDGDEITWQQVAPVTPGKEYCFSAWVKNACIVCGPDPTMELRILNGGPPVTLTSVTLTRGTTTWTKICGTFTAITPTVDLQVWILANSIAGNDAMLDDVSLKEVCPEDCCDNTCGPNLVTNWNFGAPCYTAYTSDLNPQSPCNTPGYIGSSGYTETTDASTYSSNWQGLDHTGDGSKFMLIDGPTMTAGDKKAWGQPVQVTPGRTYCFSAWVKNACIVCGPDPVLELRVMNGGMVTLTSISPPRGTSEWTQVCGTFTAITPTVELMVWIKASSSAGNDAMLDDLSLKEVCEPHHRLAAPVMDSSAELHAFPVPVQKGATLQVTYIAPADDVVRVQVLDVAGKLISETVQQVSAGTNQLQVGTDGLEPGVYFISVAGAQSKVTNKFLVE